MITAGILTIAGTWKQPRCPLTNEWIKMLYICNNEILLLFSHPVRSDFLWPHGLQHARPPCPSLSPGVCPSSCSLHQWCRPAILSSDTLFFCPQSFPESITDFSNESPVYIRWPKYRSFSFSISPSSEYLGLISLKIDWFEKKKDWLIWSPCCPRDFQESS